MRTSSQILLDLQALCRKAVAKGGSDLTMDSFANAFKHVKPSAMRQVQVTKFEHKSFIYVHPANHKTRLKFLM